MSQTSEQLRPRVGQTIAGRYRLEALLGAGGFGEVYRATQLDLDRQVAFKLLLNEKMVSQTSLKRFQREAELARELEHPNTVHLYDFGQTEGGHPFIVYQLLQGRTLTALLEERGRLPMGQASRIVSQVLKSLMEAHEHGIVHRDIKPDNIFLTEYEGEPDYVKVLDFGIAKPTGPGRREATMTADDEIVGTPSYMAPEQILAEPVGPPTDLYAVGLVMAEMLTGQVVMGGRKGIQILAAHLSDDPIPLPSTVESSPFGRVVRRATAKLSLERYQRAGEMLDDLRRVTVAMSREQLETTLPPSSSHPELVGASELSSFSAVQAPTMTPSAVDRMAFAVTEAPFDGGPQRLRRRPSRLRRFLVAGLVVAALGGGGLAAALVMPLVLAPRPSQPSTPTAPTPVVAAPSDPGPRAAGVAAPVAPAPVPAAPPAPVPAAHPADAAPPLRPVKLSELTPELLRTQLERAGWTVGELTRYDDAGSPRGVNIQILKAGDAGAVNFFHFGSPGRAAAFEQGFRRGGMAVARHDDTLLYIVLFRGLHSDTNTETAEELLRAVVVVE